MEETTVNLMLDATKSAKEVYHSLMTTAVLEDAEFVSSEKFANKHIQCVEQALEIFQIHCGRNQLIEDAVKAELQQYLDAAQHKFKMLNNLKSSAINRLAVAEARVVYIQHLADCGKLSKNRYQLEHKRCEEIASKEFKRNATPGSNCDYEKNVLQFIKSCQKSINASKQIEREVNFLLALALAKRRYNELMKADCRRAELCLSTEELRNEHEKNMQESLEVFRKKFQPSLNESLKYENLCREEIDIEYKDFEISNEEKGDANSLVAIILAKDACDRHLKKPSEGIKSHLSYRDLWNLCQECKHSAFEQLEENFTPGLSLKFKEKRRDQLNKDIDTSYHRLLSNGNEKMLNILIFQWATALLKKSYHEFESKNFRNCDHNHRERLHAAHSKFLLLNGLNNRWIEFREAIEEDLYWFPNLDYLKNRFENSGYDVIDGIKRDLVALNFDAFIHKLEMKAINTFNSYFHDGASYVSYYELSSNEKLVGRSVIVAFIIHSTLASAGIPLKISAIITVFIIFFMFWK